MLEIIMRRLGVTLVSVLAVVVATFFLVRISGQDPVELLAGPNASAEELRIVAAELELDQPLPVQFAAYAWRLLHGDLGESWISNRPILDDLLARLPATLELLLWGTGLGMMVGIGCGLAAAAREGSIFDHLSRVVSLLGFSIPTYFLGLVLLLVFFFELGWAPPGMGRLSLMYSPPPTVTGSYLIDALLAGKMAIAGSAFSQLVLPVVAVAIVAAAPMLKQSRAVGAQILSSDYIRHARAMGLTQATISMIVLRNALVPLITFGGSELAGLIGTSALIEYVFAWGGLGQYGLNAIMRGDFTAIQGYVMSLAIFSMTIFLIVDILVWLIDPRVARR